MALGDGREGAGGIQWEAVVVEPGNLRGWDFQVVDPHGNPTGEGLWVTGPSSPPRGAGSARLFTGRDGSQGVFLSTTRCAGENLSDLSALSYSTYATAWNGQQLPYLVANLDLNGDGGIDDFLFFEPAYQTPSSGNPWVPNQGKAALNVWQRWDALSGGWWSASGHARATPGTGVKPLSHYLARYPDARIVNLPHGAGGVRVVVGLAGAGDVFEGYVDGFAIAFRKRGTLYDFEPAPERRRAGTGAALAATPRHAGLLRRRRPRLGSAPQDPGLSPGHGAVYNARPHGYHRRTASTTRGT